MITEVLSGHLPHKHTLLGGFASASTIFSFPVRKSGTVGIAGKVPATPKPTVSSKITFEIF